MPAPATCDELLDLIRRSGVVEEAKLRSHVQKLAAAAALPPDPQKLAGVLVRDGILTYFQAEQLLQGKYKRFSLGKYKVLEKLGAGGMAQVFLCEHKLMRRRVAIKVLPIPKADDPSSLARFYREARAIAAVDHPNIVRAYDIDQDENLHFLVMEYVDGTNLQELVKRIGPLECRRACHYIYGAAVGLQHAHDLGLVHRDVKPGNILIDRSGVVKILDMGLARFFHDEEDNLTRMNDENVLGTADYLAPEQALDSHTVDIRADIYSLGATFYYLLTGSAPFPEGTVAQKLIWHQNRAPRPVLSLRPDAPEALVAVIDRMMAKDPAKRYQTPAEVMAALAAWVATPIPPPAERELPQLSLAAGGGGRVGPNTATPPTATGMPRPGNQFEPNAPTVVARTPEAAGPLPVVPPPVPGLAVSAAPVWESLEADTHPVAQGDTGRPSATHKATARTPRTPPVPGRNRTLLYTAAGVVVLAAVAAGAYFAFFNRRPAPPEPTPPPPRQPIIVSRAGGENAVATLREALNRAGPGDTILVREAKLTEPKLTLDPKRHQNLMIESATPDGKPAVIEGAGVVGVAMIEATNVEGFRIRNLDFDGHGKAECAIQIAGTSPGATLQGVTVRNVKGAGVRLQNAAGAPGRGVLIDHVRVLLVPDADGVFITAAPTADTRLVTVRGCRFEGPGRAGVWIDGPAVDVDITANRFFGNKAAVTFPKLGEGKPLKVVVNHNTIYQAAAGVSCEFTPGDQRGKLEVVLNQNYFAQTPALANVVVPPVPPGMPPMPPGRVPVAGISSADNAYGPGCGLGTCQIAATELPTPQLPPPDPNNDATFLRFPGGPPEIAPGKKVGAP